jgi:hypothetical protein
MRIISPVSFELLNRINIITNNITTIITIITIITNNITTRINYFYLTAHNSKETGEIFRISPRKSARGIRPLEVKGKCANHLATEAYS